LPDANVPDAVLFTVHIIFNISLIKNHSVEKQPPAKSQDNKKE
jgi:hypothetical protein